MLCRVAQYSGETATVDIGDNRDGGIADSAADNNDCQEPVQPIVRSACGSKEHAGRKREGDGCRCDQNSGAPLLEDPQRRGHFAVAEFAVEVSDASFAGDSVGETGSDYRARGGDCGVFVPQVAASCGENRDQDVGAGEGGQRGAIEDREKKKPQRAEVAEGCGQAPSARRWALEEEVQALKMVPAISCFIFSTA